jgi:hypothetical protein
MKILYFGNAYPSAIGIINLDIKSVIDRKYHDIQFHNFMESAEEHKNNIRTHLQKEFNIVYDFFFVWEGWTRKGQQ